MCVSAAQIILPFGQYFKFPKFLKNLRVSWGSTPKTQYKGSPTAPYPYKDRSSFGESVSFFI